MPITLTKGATTLTLPNDLLWADEFLWSTTRARSGYSAGGALLLDVGTKLAGRPITLQGGADYAWAQRGQALTLRSWTDDPTATMTLVYRDVSYVVGFAPVEVPFSFDLLSGCYDPADTDDGFFVLQLIITG